MTDPTIQAVINQTVALIRYYGFETGRYTAAELVVRWLETHPPIWVRLAAIEALYQGRYKALSIEQILFFWLRRGCPAYHFNHEFESIVCREIPLFPNRREDEKKLQDAIAAIVQSEEVLASQNESQGEVAPSENRSGLGALANSLTDDAIASEPAIAKPHRPIHKFTPPRDGSEFYHKLKRVTDNESINSNRKISQSKPDLTED